MKTDTNINWNTLRDCINNRRTYKDKLYKVSENSGVRQPTLSRFMLGQNSLSDANLKLICLWLERPVEDFQIEREGKNIADLETAKELSQRFDQLAGLVAKERITRSKFRELVRDELELMSSRQYFLEKIKIY